MISLIETPALVRMLQSSVTPPGRSLILTLKRSNRASEAKPRSRHRVNVVVSMLPPLTTKTSLMNQNDDCSSLSDIHKWAYFLPSNSSSFPESTAARAVAPPPSTTTIWIKLLYFYDFIKTQWIDKLFSCSARCKIANVIHSSFKTIVLSTSDLAVANALHPTVWTAKPSANVSSTVAWIGLPFSRASEKLGHLIDSTA